MCGIAGILDWENDPKFHLSDMLDIVTHRGPDDEGRFVQGPLAMGMRRLSIIDLNGGHQPISNEDESVVVVFNGEIYNYVELRESLEKRGHQFKTKTDTEVLVHLYEDEGVKFLPRLNGMFGFAIWDRALRRLFVARDRLGIKPMYYAELSKGLIFASELKSILAAGLVNCEIDPNAVFDYLTYFYLPGQKTPFTRVGKLLPGHYILADEHGSSIGRWWDLSEYTCPVIVSRQTACEKIRELFFDSVRLRMRSDVPVGTYLSGGLDSSLVTAVAARHAEINLSSFSAGFADSEFNELSYARIVAMHAGTNHHELQVTAENALELLPTLVWHMDEPNGDSAILSTFLVSRLASANVKVALSGIGADELFGGYPRYHSRLGKFAQLSRLPKWCLCLLRPLLSSLKDEWGVRIDRLIQPPPIWIRALEQTHRFNGALLPDLLNKPEQEIGHYIQMLFERYPGNNFVNQHMYVDAHSYLPDQILALTDRMSMAVSLEARTPFLDYRLVEFVTGLSGNWKVEGSRWKIILKEALGDLVPPLINKRPKWGFAAPIHNWMRDEKLESLVDLLRAGSLVKSGIVDGQVLRCFLAAPVSRSRWGEWLWALIVLELWFRAFGTGKILPRPENTFLASAK